jgi:uncharacterized protein (DUF1684 family)
MTIQTAEYQQKLDEWRQQAEKTLRAPDGWLSVAGLFWLSEGNNSFGSDPSNDIVLPESAPAYAGAFVVNNHEVRLAPAADIELTQNGQAPNGEVLRSSATGKPDIIELGDLQLFVHQSGSRLAIRLRDPNNPVRLNFAGRKWFEADEEWVIKAEFVAYEPAKILQVPNIVGDISEQESPGFVRFSVDGVSYQLDATAGANGGLFLHFHDQTAGKGSYPGGRFLFTKAPHDGKVELDFNRAVNPPCAVTAYATCPAILPQNRLALSVTAGEQWSGTHN